MPSSLDLLSWEFLTPAINEIKAPSTFLKNFLFPNHQSVPTETITMSLVTRGRKMAPFVRRGAEGIMVGGYGESSSTVEAPNIRIKRPINPSDMLYTRRAGSNVFVNSAEQRRYMQQHVVRELASMTDQIAEREEWLASQALQGVITYNVEGKDSFTIDFARSASHSYALTSALSWDNVDPTLPRPLKLFKDVKKLLSDSVGLQPTDVILGLNAANAVYELAESGNLPQLKTDTGIRAGTLSLVENYRDDGVLFIGEMGNLRLWEYSRTATDDEGNTVSYIRPDYAEFVCNTPAADRVLYYASIPDMQAINGGNYIGERFSKSWEIEDPSSWMMLAASRPLPVPRRPDASVSVKVTNN